MTKAARCIKAFSSTIFLTLLLHSKAICHNFAAESYERPFQSEQRQPAIAAEY